MALALALWLAPGATAADQLLETMTVDAGATTVTTGTAPLKTGTEYQLQISGTFTLANGFGQSFDEDALYCFGDQGFTPPQCTPTPQRFGDFYIGSGSSRLKNIDAYQGPGGGGPQLGYGITHRYNVNFYPPSDGPLTAGGTLAQSHCKSGSSPCTTTVTGTITVQIYGPSGPPPPPPPPPRLKPTTTFVPPLAAWGRASKKVQLAAGAGAVVLGPKLAKGQKSATESVTGTGLDKTGAVTPSLATKAVYGYCLAIAIPFALDTKTVHTPITLVLDREEKQQITMDATQEVQKSDEEKATDLILMMLACLDAVEGGKGTNKAADASIAASCPAGSAKLDLQELDTKRIRYRRAGRGGVSGLTASCARTSTGFTIQLKSRGKDLRSILGPRLMMGLSNNRTATGPASAQVTFLKSAAPPPQPPQPPPPPTVTGTWNTNFGPMTLTQTGGQVTGTYADCPNNGATISGAVAGSVLDGTWTEPCHNAQGLIHFVLSADGSSFTGLWGVGSATPTGVWTGTRAP